MSKITREHIEKRAESDPFIKCIVEAVLSTTIEDALIRTNEINAKEDAERRAGREERFERSEAKWRSAIDAVTALKGDSRLGAFLKLVVDEMHFALARVVVRGLVLPWVDSVKHAVDAKVMMADEERTICRVCSLDDPTCDASGCYFKRHPVGRCQTVICTQTARGDGTRIFYLPIATLFPKPVEPKKPVRRTSDEIKAAVDRLTAPKDNKGRDERGRS